MVLLILVTGCGPKLTPEEEILQADNQYLHELLQQWYWWRDDVDLAIEPSEFTSPEALLDQVRYEELDRWSYVGNWAEFNALFSGGNYAGYGFGAKWDADGNLWIRSVYDDSPFGEAGVERGWKMLAVDGTDVQSITDFGVAFGPNEEGVSNTFLLEDLEGETHEMTLAKTTVNINAVLHRSVIEQNETKIGYLVFNTFVATANQELDEAFAYISSEGATELVLDLRYNGGGSVLVAEYLANYLAPSSAQGQVFSLQQHVSDRSENDVTYTINKQGGLELSRITILTTNSSASASDLIINGLRPFLDVVLIGTEATRGKPVGSYGWQRDPYVYSLIAFRMINADGEADYFNGFEPNQTAGDGLAYAWGDPEETMLAAALQYYGTGVLGRAFIEEPAFSHTRDVPLGSRWQEEIGSW